MTIDVARWFAPTRTVADLSCGDGAVAAALDAHRTYLGDLAPGWDICGPIEETVDRIPKVDLFVCTETVEHLDDPDGVLARIREKTFGLVLSTPVAEFTDGNPEHYWGWDADDVEDMLQTAGFTPEIVTLLSVRPLGVTYQIWGCR